VDAWTVLKFSIVFYLSMLVVVLVAGMLLWAAASATGVIHNLEKFIKELFALESFHISVGKIFKASLLGGFVLVLLGTGANVLMALVYNLTSDVIGGIEITVLEEDTSTAPRRTVV
jgi:hypothetical protein